MLSIQHMKQLLSNLAYIGGLIYTTEVQQEDGHRVAVAHSLKVTTIMLVPLAVGQMVKVGLQIMLRHPLPEEVAALLKMVVMEALVIKITEELVVMVGLGG